MIPRQTISFPVCRLLDLFMPKRATSMLQERLRKIFGMKRALFTDSARDSIYLVLKEMRKTTGEKDEIIVSAFNFSLMPQIIKEAGYRPIYADIDPQTLNVDPAAVKKAIGNRTAGIIATHLFGRPVKHTLFELAHQQGLFVLEDCAHCYSSHYLHQLRRIPVGTLGAAAVFSLNFSKRLSSIYGAIINDNTKEIPRPLGSPGIITEARLFIKKAASSLLFTRSLFTIAACVLVRPFALQEKPDVLDNWSRDAERYVGQEPRSLGTLATACFKRSLHGYQRDVRRLISMKKLYDSLLEKQANRDISFVPYLYPVRVSNRKEAKKDMYKKGIDIKMEYCVDLSGGICSHAADAERTTIYLPFNGSLKRKDLRRIVDASRPWLISTQ